MSKGLIYLNFSKLVIFIFVAVIVSSCASLDQQTKRLIDLSRQKTESDSSSVKQLIAAGADVNAYDRDGMTALYLASCNDNLEMVQQLVDHGAGVNVQTRKEKTPLHCAAASGHLRIVEYLLAHGANVDARNEALVIATINKHHDVAKTLIVAGADVNYISRSWTPLLFACLKDNKLPLVQLLVENGARDDLGDKKDGFTPLYVAAEANRLDVVKFLVEHGADVNQRIGNGRTPLYAASRDGNLAVTKFLISKGAVINVVDKYGGTPLIGTAYEGYTDVVKVLLDHGANPNTKRNDGFFALYLASQNGNLGVVKQLVAGGADIDAVYSEYSMTSLWKAAHKGRFDVVKFLLDSGANKHIAAKKTFGLVSATPAEIARKMGYEEVYRLISNHK